MKGELIYRRNAVRELLRGSRRTVHKLLIQKGLSKKEATLFLRLANERHIPVEEVDKQRLGNLAKDKGHQGVIAQVGDYQYADIDDMLALAQSRDEMPFLLVLDLVQGPQNIGMLLRTAEAVGVHGIIMQDRRAPDITPAMVMASQGATEHLLVAKETNLNTTLRDLKTRDIWVVGTDMDGQQLGTADLNMPIALVIGHEGSGIRQQVRENCDLVLQIPMRGHVESLNAAVSGSVLLYAAWQARGF